MTQLSVLELVRVLMSRYGLDKAKVGQVVEGLLEMAELNVEQPAILEATLKTWQNAKADFADCFILETVKSASETPLATFDATLAKLDGCKKL